MNPAEFANIAATEEGFWWFRGMNRMLWDFLASHYSPSEGDRALEVGCGTGFVSAEFAKRYRGVSLSSMDLAAEGLRYAQGRGLRGLTQGDIRCLPFAAGSFQALLVLDVIAHLERGEEEAAFAEFARVLAAGGLLVLRASAFSWLQSRHSLFVNERQRYTLSGLLPAMRRAGFVPTRYTYANSLLLPVALFKFRVWEPLTNASPESGLEALPPALNGALESVLMTEAAMIRTGARFPVGQSLWVIARKGKDGCGQ
jgi:SAM-dependent methyltransferase